MEIELTLFSIFIPYHRSNKKVEYSGNLILHKDGYIFTQASVLKGHSGLITLHVQDEKNQLTKDSVSIQLDSGICCFF